MKKVCLLLIVSLLSTLDIRISKDGHIRFYYSILQATDQTFDEELQEFFLGTTTSDLDILPEAIKTEVDSQSLDLAIENHLNKRKKRAKNKRFLWGVLAGTTTGGVAKIMGGFSLFLTSLYNLNNPGYSLCPTNSIVVLNSTDNLADIVTKKYILDFSSAQNHSVPINEFHASWFLNINRICAKQNSTSLQGIYITGIISGIILVGSGFVDMMLAIDPFLLGGNEMFRKHVVKAYALREQDGKKIKNSQLEGFLRFAEGEFVDLYQKRGSFNSSKFLSALVKW